MKRVSLKRIILPLLLTLMGASIAVGAYVATKGGSLFKLRKKAAPATPSSRLYFQGPSQVKIGEQFSVDLNIDTTNDPKYTISGVDARLALVNNVAEGRKPGSVVTLVKVNPRKIFESYPTNPSPCGGAGTICPKGGG